MSLNTVKVPTLEQLGEVAAELGFAFSEGDLAAHHEALMPAFEAYNTIDRMPDELPPVTGSHRTCMGLFLSSGCYWVFLTVLCSERERPFFVPSPAIRFAERAEGVKGPKR